MVLYIENKRFLVREDPYSLVKDGILYDRSYTMEKSKEYVLIKKYTNENL